jgi:hypothetical protein
MGETPSLDAALQRGARTAIGDELRSLTYFTEDAQRQVYLRDDLEPGANVAGFAEIERLGFRSQHDYGDSELGEYEFTIRVFEYGYLTRVMEGDHGAFVTTGEMRVQRFSDLAVALREVLAERDPMSAADR